MKSLTNFKFFLKNCHVADFNSKHERISCLLFVIYNTKIHAGVAELVDAEDSKSSGRMLLRVQVSPSVPIKQKGLAYCQRLNPFYTKSLFRVHF